ncbi:putative L-xylulose reductase [Helianthus annuus]|uniref:L-xylulose reductase n=1 Tax=Helianthus annuus TaxID=4232 RepID=A0A9K3EFD9_HELAN|nr:putative L-xylulose reductase [Helianthus annuus]
MVHLINVDVLQSPLDLSQKDWDRTFNTNLRGSWLVTKYVCLQMRAISQGGSVINISSVAGLRVHPHKKVAYASSKSALDTMTKVK